jgi:hypothetical protein
MTVHCPPSSRKVGMMGARPSEPMTARGQEGLPVQQDDGSAGTVT